MECLIVSNMPVKNIVTSIVLVITMGFYVIFCYDLLQTVVAIPSKNSMS